MVWCENCTSDVTAEDDYQAGYSCCPLCGAVLVEGTYENAVAFGEEGGMIGQILSDEKKPQQNGTGGLSARGFHEITLLVDQLHIHPRDDTIDAARRLYKMAVMRSFLKGRRSNQVAACCIYIMCRSDKKPYLLIDFSDALRINVYVLGCVFLDLCYLFKLDEHPIILSPVDPSLFIHRYVDRLNFGNKASVVTQSTLKLIKSMNRDWIQTGRKPSGICAAALFIASHIHNVPRTKRDIIYVARIGVSTIAKRLTEFCKTKPGKLNADEFHKEALKMERLEQALLTHPSATGKPKDGAKCHHLESGAEYFACGMCRNCYIQYLSISGGIFEGTANPPAFTKGSKRCSMTMKKMLKLTADYEADEEQQRVMEKEMREAPAVTEVEAEMDIALSSQQLNPLLHSPVGAWTAFMDAPQSHAFDNEPDLSLDLPSTAPLPLQRGMDFEEELPFDEEDDPQTSQPNFDTPDEKGDTAADAAVEIDMLEDIADEDVEDYILPVEESRQKSNWWRELHKEYLAKAELRKKLPIAKEKKRRRTVKKAHTNTREYPSAFEAVKGVLEERGLSSKINYDKLEALFAEGTEEAVRQIGPATPLPSEQPRKRDSYCIRSLSFNKANQKPRKRLDGLFD